MHRYCILLLLFLLNIPRYSYLQAENSDSVAKPSFRDRIAIHTNTLGWLLLTPNVGFEYDIVHNDINKVSVLLSARYNWDSNHKSAPRYVYNILGAQAELRWYFRTRKREAWETDMVRNTEGLFNRILRSRHLLTAKNNPRTHRAYYIGPYINYDNVTLKLSDTGKQGTSFGAGVTFGYTAPLYIYGNGSAIDFEIGASVGVLNVAYDEFGYSSSDNCYIYKGKEKRWIPYPVLSDARLSLVYRPNPIRNQIKGFDEEELAHTKRMYELMAKYKEKNRLYMLSDSLEHWYDSLQRWNRVIENKNSRIKAINREIMSHETADSTMLLEELRPAYKYIEMPSKLLNHGSKRMLANKEMSSVEDFDIAYLNSLVKDHSKITTGNGVESIEDVLLKRYNNIRQIYLNNNDTVSKISYYELLVDAIPFINASIKQHNSSYVEKGVSQEANLLLKSLTYPTGVGNNAIVMPFVGIDSMYVKDTDGKSGSVLSLNEEIEARNLVKLSIVKDSLGIVDEEKQNTLSEDKVKNKEKQKKDKQKKDNLKKDNLKKDKQKKDKQKKDKQKKDKQKKDKQKK